MKVKAIRAAGTADVYNMEVEDTHDFTVSGGIVVHNCYDELRYMCMKNPITPKVRSKPAIELNDPLNMHQDAIKYDRYEFYKR